MNQKKKNTGCMSGVLGTIFVLLGVGAYAVISLLINRIFTANQGESSCSIMTLYFTGITVAFVLYEIIFITWQIKLTNLAQGKSDASRFDKILKIVAITCICLSLLFSIVVANTYTVCTNDSIETVCFVTVREYKWNNVSRFILSCDENGSLEYTIKMKDGEVIELFNNVNTCSQEFLDDHKSLSGYAAFLTEQFRNSGFIIDEQIVGKEYFQKVRDSNPDVWENLNKIIGNE